MGTRHLTGVRVNGELKVAQYGQWDGYPTGQGETVSTFLREADMDKFRTEVEKLRWITEAEGKEINQEYTDRGLALPREYTRDTGAEILQMILDGKVTTLVNEEEFLKDTVFCEFAYILDLDKQAVEFYNGGTKPYKMIPFAEFSLEEYPEKLEKELSAAYED